MAHETSILFYQRPPPAYRAFPLFGGSDYPQLKKELKVNKGATSINFRKLMAARAFSLTAYYDSVLSNWLNNLLDIKFPEKKTIHGKFLEKLRYGENPHQQGSIYSSEDILGLEKLHGA